MLNHMIAETNTTCSQGITSEELDRLIEAADRAKAKAYAFIC